MTVARADSGDILIEAEEPFDAITVQPLTLETECVRHAWTTEGELLTWEQDRQRQTLALRVTSDGAISTRPSGKATWRPATFPCRHGALRDWPQATS